MFNLTFKLSYTDVLYMVKPIVIGCYEIHRWPESTQRVTDGNILIIIN